MNIEIEKRKNRMNNNSVKHTSLSKNLRYIIMSILLPMVIFIFVLLGFFWFYSAQYSKIMHNVTVGSEFNIDFKNNLDLKMYHYAVGSSEQKEIPVEDVNDAIAIAEALQDTTYCAESKQAIQNILDYCSNLKERIYALSNTENYDSRMSQLENNIYVLTSLVQENVTDYIYYEAGYMAEIEAKMMSVTKIVIVVAVIFVIATVLLLINRALKFSNSITRPISELCENVRKVGHGDFDVPNIETNDLEIEQLNEGIRKMAGRIEKLLINVKEEEKLQHKTQLQLLQAQVNPHFLYNTLDTIIWLVESDKNEQAIKMLGSLSVFFRTALSKGNDIIRLEDEVAHTRSYLEIQQSRYRDIMDYEINLPDDMKEIMVPKLMIQPLAENALYHGVKEKRGKSKIIINCEKIKDDEVLITVKDNGIGMTPERLEEIKKSVDGLSKEGFGLNAVNDRIKLYFGDEYGISIESEYGEGTTVKVHLTESCADM